MKIEQIILNNFGSYEGENVFNTKVTDNRTIVLIGGKNGAGKTTLLTAMRLCMYGYLSMGHKSMNSYYTRAVTKLINNKAKLHKPVNACVKMSVSISNGHSVDIYTLNRAWELDSTLKEIFTVFKNGEELNSNEIADFENYLLAMIPPELFNFYFFDGEKIADFFMNEGSNTRIKNAFLTLCGYDTFEIMRKNFKRVASSDSSSTSVLDEYLLAKENLQQAQNKVADISHQLEQCKDDIITCDSEISELNKNYIKNGGITQDEWDGLQAQLREEEHKREQCNLQLKKWANDIVPFLMIKPQIEKLKSQIHFENESQKIKNFCEIVDSLLSSGAFSSSKIETLDEVRSYVVNEFKSECESILDLSFEKTAGLIALVNGILSFNENEIEKCKAEIKKSLVRSAKIRKKLEGSNISGAQSYITQKAELFEQKTMLLETQVKLEQELVAVQALVEECTVKLNKVKNELESELKKASVNDISTKAIVMLDKLQETLYHKQIEKVESSFREEIKTLMRKTDFIDDIYIDDDFGIHIYRNQEMRFSDLITVLKTNSEAQVKSLLGEKAISVLLKLSKATTISGIESFCEKYKNMATILPIEIDKTSLSSGEKQIFIMALYHSMVELGNHEIPFIIDTPFARIDTEHRYNISKHFFSALKGQVFILSTNEEINTTHFKLLEDKIASTYMLENSDNKKTNIISNTYFEV